jgi:hypothetical protein
VFYMHHRIMFDNAFTVVYLSALFGGGALVVFGNYAVASCGFVVAMLGFVCMMATLARQH